jgi:polynucleotide 5'-kinase involved in rRNA processing
LSSSSLSKNAKLEIYRTIILPVVCMGVKLGRSRSLRVFENKMLRRIFGPKRDEVTEEWRKLHNEELSDLCSSPNIFGVKIKKNEMGGACSTYGGRGEVHKRFW